MRIGSDASDVAGGHRRRPSGCPRCTRGSSTSRFSLAETAREAARATCSRCLPRSSPLSRSSLRPRPRRRRSCHRSRPRPSPEAQRGWADISRRTRTRRSRSVIHSLWTRPAVERGVRRHAKRQNALARYVSALGHKPLGPGRTIHLNLSSYSSSIGEEGVGRARSASARGRVEILDNVSCDRCRLALLSSEPSRTGGRNRYGVDLG
jgi:hypothetical protein